MDFLERYRFDFKNDLLGYGGFGEVYKAYDTLLNREVALKFYKGRGSSKYDLITEIKKVIRLHHPNLLEFYDATILSQQNAFGQFEDLQVGVMEYANEGDLLDFIASNPTKEEIRIVTLGILSGLKFMHENGFIHRDLKPQNILFVKKGKRIIPKIADFGISKNALGDNTNDSTKLIGTVEYMAPEQFNPKFAIENKPHYNLDLWALGVMLFELLSGQPPFGKRSQTTHSEQIMHNICYEQIPNKFENIDEPFRTVLNRCLVKDANKRARSASELIDIIINYKDDKVDEKVNVASKNQLNKKLNRSLERKEINTTSSKGKKIKGIILVLFLIFLGVASYFLFNKGSKVVVNSNKSFRNYIDLADKESGLMTLIYLDTALLYLDSSYTAYEFGDSIQEPRVLNEVLEEIKNKKLKATDNLKEEEIELRALDILTIESSFDGWEEINKVWLEEVFKLNQN